MIFTLFNMILFGGILVQPFRIAEAEPGHQQVCLRADMAADGKFAVSWIDSTSTGNYEVFIRFFDKDGSPLTEPYGMEKVDGNNWVYWPCLEMDTLGNAVLVWLEDIAAEQNKIRYQRFDSDGNPIIPALTIKGQTHIGHVNRPVDASVNNSGQFAVAWDESITTTPYGIWTQRFDLDGSPLCEPFIVHDNYQDYVVGAHFTIPQVALSDSNDLVVTWIDFLVTHEKYSYPKFQVFDAQNSSILPWEPWGHCADSEDSVHYPSRIIPVWLDNDRFVLFWADRPLGHKSYDLCGRVFADRGLTRGHLCDHLLPDDTLATTLTDPKGQYCIDITPETTIPLDNTSFFVFAYNRIYYDSDDLTYIWDHQGALIGTVKSTNWLSRRTYFFEFTPPWDADTSVPRWPHFSNQAPAVAVCKDRIVWSYCRYNSESELEAWVMISDWDMPAGVEEESVITSPIKLTSTLNSLSYALPGEGTLILYNSAGRKLTEEVIHGKGEWLAIGLPTGVYFARITSDSESACTKIVVVR